MADRPEERENRPYDEVLEAAERHARAWLSGLHDRPVPPRLHSDDIKERLGRELPESGEPAVDVIERLAEGAEPGLSAIGSPRFYGWVIGGTCRTSGAAEPIQWERPRPEKLLAVQRSPWVLGSSA